MLIPLTNDVKRVMGDTISGSALSKPYSLRERNGVIRMVCRISDIVISESASKGCVDVSHSKLKGRDKEDVALFNTLAWVSQK